MTHLIYRFSFEKNFNEIVLVYLQKAVNTKHIVSNRNKCFLDTVHKSTPLETDKIRGKRINMNARKSFN